YLTGLNLGGENIAILLDASSSMLSETIIDIYRYRGLAAELQREAPKWLRAVKTVEWIIANLPPRSTFQLIVFNETAQTLNTEGKNAWVKVAEVTAVDRIIERLSEISPSGGTNLFKAWAKLDELNAPYPDNIILITDGLPTQGEKPLKPGQRKVTSDERRRYLRKVQAQAGRTTPVNIILFPLEGDPFAETDYWEWSQNTRGSFMTPSANWP
ncbi:MAG: vWA domain-containing protein, partial [Gammaproteobacteria bacterium]